MFHQFGSLLPRNGSSSQPQNPIAVHISQLKLTLMDLVAFEFNPKLVAMARTTHHYCKRPEVYLKELWTLKKK